MKKNKHIGSSFDSFLDDNEIRSDVEELASCKFLAIKLSEELESKGMTVSEFARKMGSTRAVATRILNPKNTSLTFKTATKAASALGMKFKVQLVEA
ncbi:MAG: helix-turn-helix domain-containing protein [Opitutales bacterium]|nr:helix-turn-helix domain-containing protein [Opitutales bacterium]